MKKLLWVKLGTTGLLALSTGCGSGDSNKSVVATDQFKELMAGDWTISPGEEAYFCGYKTLTEDLYVSDFRPMIPSGTHHVVLGYQDPATADGYVKSTDPSAQPAPSICTGVTFGDVFAYVATVGSEPLSMPKGVAVKIPKGQQLVLGLHVLNATTAPMSGRSGVETISPVPSEVTDEAEVIAVIPPPQNLSVPPGPSTATGVCTLKQDASIVAVAPHMHKMGVHITVTGGPNGVGTTLLDAPYVFTDQKYTTFDPVKHFSAGDQIHVACDYNNTSTNTLHTSESTTQGEMCIGFTYRYPAIGLNQTPLGPGVPRGYCMN